MISASQGLLLTAYLFGHLARRFGVRVVIAASFAAGAVASIGAGFAGFSHPYVAIGLLLTGSLAASALDGVGGIPYLRAVRSHERANMGPVYRTFIDFSDLIPSFVFSFALLVFQVNAVFIIMGLGLLVCGYLSWRYLPRSM
jgi:MFS family permease